MLRRILIKLINNYQLKGGGKEIFNIECNFTPTCSEYMKISLIKYGLIKGLWNGARRFFRCNKRDSLNIEVDIP